MVLEKGITWVRVTRPSRLPTTTMSTQTFIHDTPRVVFGSRTLSNNLSQELQHLHCSKPFIISTQSQSNHLRHLQIVVVGSYAHAALHTPVHVTEEALRLVKDAGADCLVALGGGSSIGLSKALALRTNLPQIAIPTTYSGSEVHLHSSNTNIPSHTHHRPPQSSDKPKTASKPHYPHPTSSQKRSSTTYPSHSPSRSTPASYPA